MREKNHILALDLGGTNFRVALANRKGKLLKRHGAPTHGQEGRERVIARINKALREVVAPVGWEGVLGLGVAAAGPLDPETGVLFTPPHLPGWRDVPLKALWEEELGLPVWVGNDANLAALAEHRFGAGRGTDNLVYLTVSTGIGGGVILGGKLLLGAHGLAGELGHMTIEAEGPRCDCGNRGCLEALASGTAIARLAVERISRGEGSALVELVKGDLTKVTAKAVVAAARCGDALAREVLEEAGTALGIGVVNLLHIFNPERVIIGGGVSQAGELILEPVRRVVSQRAMPNFREGLSIVTSALGDDAGLVGAVSLVLDKA